jgi:hypothetical protein
VQVVVAELRAAEALDDVAHLRGELRAVGDVLAAQQVLVEMLVQRHGRLDRVDDDGVAEQIADLEADEDGHRARGRDVRLLQPLQPGELAHRGVAADEPLQTRRGAGVELQVVGPPIGLEAPYLAVAAVFDDHPVAREVFQKLFEGARGHGGMIRARTALRKPTWTPTTQLRYAVGRSAGSFATEAQSDGSGSWYRAVMRVTARSTP